MLFIVYFLRRMDSRFCVVFGLVFFSLLVWNSDSQIFLDIRITLELGKYTEAQALSYLSEPGPLFSLLALHVILIHTTIRE